jgi:preprotein translocase SecE subunit
MKKISVYIHEAVEELHHVRWPTRHQAIRLSIIVLGFVLVTAVLFGAVDFLLAELVKFLLSLS